MVELFSFRYAHLCLYSTTVERVKLRTRFCKHSGPAYWQKYGPEKWISNWNAIRTSQKCAQNSKIRKKKHYFLRTRTNLAKKHFDHCWYKYDSVSFFHDKKLHILLRVPSRNSSCHNVKISQRWSKSKTLICAPLPNKYQFGSRFLGKIRNNLGAPHS